MSNIILGIDLGTTNSLWAVSGGPSGAQVSELVPSVVAILPNGTFLVGEDAKDLAWQHPERVVHSVKRLIGRSTSELRLEASRLPYQVVEGQASQARIRIPLDGKEGRGPWHDYSPEEVSAMILGDIKRRAERALGIEQINEAVITVPAYFDEAQRQATKRASELAHFTNVRLVNEPTAAAMAYGIDGGKDGTVLVYDLGGGTFDVSVLKIMKGVFRVLATHGDTQLGGDDFDRKILTRVLKHITEATGAQLGDDPRVLQTLRRSAEGLKIRLSQEDHAELEINAGAAPLTVALSRDDFEQLIATDVARTMRCVEAAIADASLDASAIDDIVLVGGSTRIRAVRAALASRFGREPHTEIDPDRAVALGAAVQAGVLAGDTKDLLLLDIVPLSLGIETLGGAFSKLILRNTTVPCSVMEEFSTQVENQTGIDLNIFQGERELVADCRQIGSFRLTGIPAMPAGLPRVAVTFTVDQHGLLRVSARELRSGQTASIEVLPTLGLSKEEVRHMVAESIDKAQEDILAREALDMHNKAEAIVRGTEEALAHGSEGLAPEQAYSIKKALARVKGLQHGEDLPALHTALEELSSMTMQLADDLIGAAVRKAIAARKERVS